ncbi:MAG: hypothetical protein EXX96DRAFT_605102 [Benjaminiella poitrasii]|nr:MAG: hypothetical protein EXX96DRAFT_605102 [Benjaminiella poitrasii]
MNMVTRALLNTEYDYIPESSEWPNGTRNDVILAHKSDDTVHPSIIIEFQRAVDKAFMKRAIGYCLQASKRFDTEPVILIVCIESVEVSVIESLRKCDDLPCYTASCCYAEVDLEDYQNTEGFKNQKRKFGGLNKEDYIKEGQQQEITCDYEGRMEFIKKFMQDRAETNKAMSWELCLLEGKQKCNWNYKSANSLRMAFAKDGKRKQ